MSERFKCENPKCKKRGVEDLMQLNPLSVNLKRHYVKNKKTQALDDKKLALAVIDAGRWRCASCFETFLRRHAYSEYYHLIENKGISDEKKTAKEDKNSNEPEGQREETQEIAEQTTGEAHASNNTSTVPSICH